MVVASEHRDRTRNILAEIGAREMEVSETQDDSLRISVAMDEDPELLPILRAPDAEGIDVHDIGRRRASLDEAFLALTGRPTERTGA